MRKIFATTIMAVFLTACGSTQTTEEKKVEQPTETKSSLTEEKQVEKEVKKAVEKEADKSPKTATEAPKAPALAKNIFTLTTSTGKTLHVDEAEEGIIFQEHKGKVVFLLFFGYRCPPCLAEIPILKSLTNEKHSDLEIIAVEVQRLPKERFEAFKKEKGINYTLLSGNDRETNKFISYIGQRAQWGGSIPFLVALNPHGEVKVVHVGGMSEKTFKTIYNKLSAQK